MNHYLNFLIYQMPLGRLIANRELPIIRRAKELLDAQDL